MRAEYDAERKKEKYLKEKMIRQEELKKKCRVETEDEGTSRRTRDVGPRYQREDLGDTMTDFISVSDERVPQCSLSVVNLVPRIATEDPGCETDATRVTNVSGI